MLAGLWDWDNIHKSKSYSWKYPVCYGFTMMKRSLAENYNRNHNIKIILLGLKINKNRNIITNLDIYRLYIAQIRL